MYACCYYYYGYYYYYYYYYCYYNGMLLLLIRKLRGSLVCISSPSLPQYYNNRNTITTNGYRYYLYCYLSET